MKLKLQTASADPEADHTIAAARSERIVRLGWVHPSESRRWDAFHVSMEFFARHAVRVLRGF